MKLLSNSRMPLPIRYILKVYALGLCIFFSFRLILVFTNWDKVLELPQERIQLLLQAFWMGIRFDTVISNYILLLPFLLLSFFYFIQKKQKLIYQVVNIYIAIFYGIAFMLCAADIPFFNYFYSRLTTMALAWISNLNFVFSMVFQEMKYWIMLIPFVLCLGFFIFLLRKISKQSIKQLDTKRWSLKAISLQIVVSLVFGGLIFIGIRGRIEKKAPIQVGTAYFSSFAFPNQLGLNPVFTFLRSYLDDLKEDNKPKMIMPINQAYNLAQRAVGADPNQPQSIARQTNYDQIPGRKRNVVLVIMESMSAGKMGRYGNSQGLTPYLDSLAQASLSFDNTYTAGIHTYNGIFSTLYSLPAVYKKHPMKGLPIKSYGGLAPELKKAAYNNFYFTTHDDQFDNVGGFLRCNGFDHIIAQKDYPAEEILSTLGVPDHYMFQFALPHFDKAHEQQSPFFATMMTASDHGPYIIPEGIRFKSRSEDIKTQVVEYADWSIQQFMHAAQKKTWYQETIFVFVADHGYAGHSTYDMPLNYHHSPLIVFCPAWKDQNKAYQKMATQLDIGPTILGLLGINWENKTLGIDLLNQSRDYAFFCADDKLACLSDDFFLVMREKGDETLYRYKTKDSKNYAKEYPLIVKKMRTYAKAMTSVSQDIMQ